MNWISLYLRKTLCFDLRSIRLFRFFLGILLVFDALFRLQEFSFFYAHDGVFPLFFEPETTFFSIPRALLNHSEVWVQKSHFGFMLLCGIGLCLNTAPRFTSLLSWIFLLGIHQRAPLVLQGGDILFRQLFLLSFLLPPTNSIKKIKNFYTPHPWYTPSVLLFFSQVFFVYWFNALSKISEPAWQNGWGLYYALNLDSYVSFVGIYLRQFEIYLKFGSHFTVFFESLAPLLLLFTTVRSRLRFFLVLGFSFFHLMIASQLKVGLFSFIAITMWIPFLPSSFWDFIFKNKKPKNSEDFIPRNSSNPKRSTRLNFTFQSILCLGILLSITLTNIRDFLDPNLIIPRPVSIFRSVFKLDQGWRMFSKVQSTTGWIEVPGKFQDGSQWNLFEDHEAEKKLPLQKEAPKNISSYFESQRKRKFYTNLLNPSFSSARLSYVNYLCRKNKDLVSLYLVLRYRNLQPESSEMKPYSQYHLLWKKECVVGGLKDHAPSLEYLK